MKALIILPTYNEIDNLRPLVEEILVRGPYDILVVDDNSPDGTGELAERLAEEHRGRVFVLHRRVKEGLGRAYTAGFRWGVERGYDVLFEMDADFSHDPAHLSQFMREIEGGADLVLGSRNIRGGGTRNWSLLRQIISKGGSLYAQVILFSPYRDLTSGFKAFRRQVLEALDLDSIQSNGYSFQIEVTHRAHQMGFKVKETPIIFHDRKVGTSKMNGKIVQEAMGVVWKIRLSKPARRRRVAATARRSADRGTNHQDTEGTKVSK
ncbi:MAG: polyprenol monophosphomannose synthase [Chloroflexota bacterium]|nr:polyprenol monophosphomannose synthase [Chloroflexota bacterium]